MALNTTNLLTVIGKYVKAINVWNGYLSALDTAKSDALGVLHTASIDDLYVNLPSQIDGFQAAVSSWIATWINNVEEILTNEAYVVDELAISSGDITTVLNAIFDHMVEQSENIKSSVVSIGGSDVDYQKFGFTAQVTSNTYATNNSISKVFCSRLLDGLNDPSDLVSAHANYRNVESQLAMTCTTIAKIVSSSAGGEVAQLYSEVDSNPAYDDDAEKPGLGPNLLNIESNNLVPNNSRFNAWSGNNPTSWTLTGGAAGTDWLDISGTGKGPLSIKTAGTYAKQQIPDLTRRQEYFVGAFFNAVGSTGTVTTKLRFENVDGVTVHKNFGNVTTTVDALGNAIPSYIYGFYTPSDLINLDDIYVSIEHDAETNAGSYIDIHRVIVSPVTFYNGLGWVFWNPAVASGATDQIVAFINGATGIPEINTGAYGTMAVSNSNGGVFQTFFRKAYNIQLPTADSPSISDTLAT